MVWKTPWFIVKSYQGLWAFSPEDNTHTNKPETVASFCEKSTEKLLGMSVVPVKRREGYVYWPSSDELTIMRAVAAAHHFGPTLGNKTGQTHILLALKQSPGCVHSLAVDCRQISVHSAEKNGNPQLFRQVREKPSLKETRWVKADCGWHCPVQGYRSQQTSLQFPLLCILTFLCLG